MSVEYFTDRDLGKRFPAILSNAGLTVHRHCDYFAPDCRDEEWLRAVGSRGWIAITHDAQIRYKPNEQRAVIDHKVALLVVLGKAPLPELADSFVATISKIEAFLRRNPPPVIAKVYRAAPAVRAKRKGARGRVERWYPQ